MFGVPREEVFQAAGLIQNHKSNHYEFLVNRIMELNPEDQEIVEAFIDTMLERNEKKSVRGEKKPADV